MTEDQSTNILIRPTQQCLTKKSSFVPLQTLINNKDRVQPELQKNNNMVLSQIQVGDTVLRVRELTGPIVLPKSQVWNCSSCIVVVVLRIVFSCIGMKYNYRVWRNIFCMSFTYLHLMDNSTLDVKLKKVEYCLVLKVELSYNK